MMFSLLNDDTDDSEVIVIQKPMPDNLHEKQAPAQIETVMPRNLYTSVEALHAVRMNRIKKVCQEHASDLRSMEVESYLLKLFQFTSDTNIKQNERDVKRNPRMTYTWKYKFDQKHNLLYCPIPKSGWSSWKRVLFYINGVIKSMDVEIGITSDRKARVLDMAGVSITRANMTGRFRPFTFVFVRNPWERLVSAYINKALDWNYTRILHTPCEWESMKPYRPSITFEQFVRCIVGHVKAKKRLDMHWIPMWTLCDFCQINYNAVGHMETVTADAQYVIERLALNIAFPKIFSSRAHNTSDVLHSWYAAVPADLIHELRKLYKYDFLLHGYSDIPPGWESRLN